MTKIILACDIGYGNTKLVFDKTPTEWNELCFKSSVPKSTQGLSTLSREMTSSLDRIAIPVSGAQYLVGPEAHISGGAAILGTDYIERPEYLALLRGSIYYMMKKSGVVRKEIDVLALGLPVSNWQLKHVRLSAIGMGPHTIPVPAALREIHGETVEVTVKRTVVFPQPMGALHNAMADRTSLDRAGDKTIHMVIDPGYNTFDWFVSVGVRPDLQRSGSLQGGVSQLLKLVSNAAGAKLGVGSLNLNEVKRGLESGQLSSHGKRLDMREFQPLMQSAAAEVVDRFLNSIDLGLGLDTIHLAGGGAKFYIEALRKAFSDYNIMVEESSVMANARGFYLLGQSVAATM